MFIALSQHESITDTTEDGAQNKIFTCKNSCLVWQINITKSGLIVVSLGPFEHFLSPFFYFTFAFSHLQMAAQRTVAEHPASKLGDVSCHCNALQWQRSRGSFQVGPGCWHFCLSAINKQSSFYVNTANNSSTYSISDGEAHSLTASGFMCPCAFNLRLLQLRKQHQEWALFSTETKGKSITEDKFTAASLSTVRNSCSITASLGCGLRDICDEYLSDSTYWYFMKLIITNTQNKRHILRKRLFLDWLYYTLYLTLSLMFRVLNSCAVNFSFDLQEWEEKTCKNLKNRHQLPLDIPQ